MKDKGHYNCRDYHVLHEHAGAAKTHGLDGPLQRQCASPMNRPVKRAQPFPFFDLPLELRQKVYCYLLPSATARDASSIGLPFGRTMQGSRFRSRNRPVIWERGQTSLLCVSKRMHDECAALLYGASIFVLFVKYSTITFRYQWLLASGLTPTSDMDFLESFPPRYLNLLRQLTIYVDHPDSYTGMIKYNVGGKGLTHGLKKQVEKLADMLLSDTGRGGAVNLLHVELTNGNEHLDHEKQGMVRARDKEVRGSAEIQGVLEPLRRLKGVASIQITGAVTKEFARALCEDVRRL
ncbi:hypothetical protein ANO11243_048590 [Dothideomycetidae sp. 11243]|nr:hypothetical protein ANO11243_048590 [fungal sp. No.11243]